MKKLISFVVFLLFFGLNTSFALAYQIPNFPACSNPQGNLIVSYDSGTHGVVGGLAYSGSDKVYKISDDNLIQCLCTIDGQGIQTNWWKASSLDESEIEELKRSGWIYIPNGSVWGLDQGAYIAKNISYSCLSDNGTGGGDSSSSNTSSSVGQVLGLAFTGNIRLIYAILILGLISLAYGQILHRARN